MHVNCNSITIVGKGKGKTTLLGGFYVNGKQNVKIEQLAGTNSGGYGLLCAGSGTNVDVTECCFKKCSNSGMGVEKGATVIATRCDFTENGECGVACYGANTKVRLNDSTMHDNGEDGLWAGDHAVVDLHGTKTDIHSNKECGIWATGNTKVNIHLPSQHNTTHDNVGQNRNQNSGLVACVGAVVDLHGTKTDIHSNRGDGIFALDDGKVNIHLPSQHNTTHDNDEEDREQINGGSIANINADGTFTHVVVEEENDDGY
jgi:hypothetical protein